MKQITTSSGFTVELDESRLNDMELFDALCALSGGDKMSLPVVVGKILGDSKKALYDHLRAENGAVPIPAVEAEVLEIMQALKGGKNS